MKLLLLLTLFFVPVTTQRLSEQENQQLRNICGTLPKWNSRRSANFSESHHRNIFNGRLADAQASPWAVFLSFQGSVCSGTLISPRHILTARHCLEMADSRVLQNAQEFCDNSMGGSDRVMSGMFHSISVQLADKQFVRSTVTKMFVMNGCQTVIGEDDVLVLELNDNVALSATAFPVCVSNDVNDNSPGSIVHIFSFGADSPQTDEGDGIGVLRYASLTVFQASPKRFYVRDPNQRTAVRAGDSGGGFMIRRNGRITVVGVASGGFYWDSFAPSVGYFHQKICYHTGICF